MSVTVRELYDTVSLSFVTDRNNTLLVVCKDYTQRVIFTDEYECDLAICQYTLPRTKHICWSVAGGYQQCQTQSIYSCDELRGLTCYLANIDFGWYWQQYFALLVVVLSLLFLLILLLIVYLVALVYTKFKGQIFTIHTPTLRAPIVRPTDGVPLYNDQFPVYHTIDDVIQCRARGAPQRSVTQFNQCYVSGDDEASV